MEKTLRVLGGGDDDHSHGHSHSPSHSVVAPEGHASGVSISSGASDMKSRKSGADEISDKSEDNGEVQKTGPQPSKLSAYLNLFGDFVHNM